MDGGCSIAYTACVRVLALRLGDKEQCSVGYAKNLKADISSIFFFIHLLLLGNACSYMFFWGFLSDNFHLCNNIQLVKTNNYTERTRKND